MRIDTDLHRGGSLLFHMSRERRIEVIGVRESGARPSLDLPHDVNIYWRRLRRRRVPNDLRRHAAVRIRLSRDVYFGPRHVDRQIAELRTWQRRWQLLRMRSLQ